MKIQEKAVHLFIFIFGNQIYRINSIHLLVSKQSKTIIFQLNLTPPRISKIHKAGSSFYFLVSDWLLCQMLKAYESF